MPKTMWVKVAPLKDPSLTPVVFFEHTTHRKLPLDEAVEVPVTSYYLRKLHQGVITRAAAPAVKGSDE